jgi:hypothetical protein
VAAVVIGVFGVIATLTGVALGAALGARTEQRQWAAQRNGSAR